jgi:HupE / UreJ protein
MRIHAIRALTTAAVVLCPVLASEAHAHGVTELAQQRMLDGGFWAAAQIGAEHMLTGYDHLLFLFGMLLFLRRLSDVVWFVTAFTAGHLVTLMFATLAGIRANPFLIDAVIALTVIYKAFENLDGFRKWLNTRTPNLLVMVFVFGLIHGFGLSTRLQQVTLASDPNLIAKILGFNLGVELGQIAALAAMFAVLRLWQRIGVFTTVARTANVGLMAAGVALFCMQLYQYRLPTPAS